MASSEEYVNGGCTMLEILLGIDNTYNGEQIDYFGQTFTLEAFSNSLNYMNNYKAVYLISIISFVGFIYLLSCYCLGILNLKKYKTN